MSSHAHRTLGNKTAPVPVFVLVRRRFYVGGRYWVRTSDLFGVNEARYHCANRPGVRTADINLSRVTAPIQTKPTQATRLVIAADIALKVALVVLILVAVAHPDLGGVKAKAGDSRAFAYPTAMVIVPAIWWVFCRARPFPWLGDLLLCMPWFTDTLGNRLNLYDSIGWFDDWMHFMNWTLLTAGFLVITLPRGTTWLRALERALAFGVPTAVLWEITEYITFIRHSPELATAYEDTLGDLILGTIGTVLAALIVWATRRPKSGGLLGSPEPIG